MSDTERKPFIACNSSPAMSGYFASMYCWTQEEGYGFWEPYSTDFGRYETLDEAEAAGRVWAEQEGVEFIAVDREAAAAATARRALRVAYVKELKDGGMSFRDAHMAGLKKYPF